MELPPDPGGLPVAKPSPAGHAAAAAHLQRQVLPRDAGLEDEEDAVTALRLSRGLRPGNRNRRGLGGGSNGSIRSQSSSGSKGWAMGAIPPRDTHFYVKGSARVRHSVSVSSATDPLNHRSASTADNAPVQSPELKAADDRERQADCSLGERIAESEHGAVPLRDLVTIREPAEHLLQEGAS